MGRDRFPNGEGRTKRVVKYGVTTHLTPPRRNPQRELIPVFGCGTEFESSRAAAIPPTTRVEVANGPSRARFVDDQSPITMLAAIERVDRGAGFVGTRHLDDSKPARLAGSRLDLNVGRFHCPIRLEEGPQLI